MRLGKYLVTTLVGTAAVHSAPSIAPYSSRDLNTDTNVTMAYDPSSFVSRTVDVNPSESADSSRSIFSRFIDTISAAYTSGLNKRKGGGKGGGRGGGQSGKNGKNGKDGKAGKDGKDGKDLSPGKSGPGGNGPAGCTAGTVGCTTATGQASGGGNSTKHSSSSINTPSHMLMTGALAGTALYMI